MKIKLSAILIYLLISPSAWAQSSLSIQFDYAEKLFNEKQYFDSITEFKRLLFIDSDGQYSYRANLLIGECYKEGAKFDDAIKYFSFAAKNSNAPEENFEARTQIIRTNILRRTTDRALQLCDELDTDPAFVDKKDEINYWRGWAYIFADDWKNASLVFGRIDPNHELKILAEKTEKAKVSVTCAKVISYILPGAGAIYCGNFLSGLMSAGWNLLAGYWTMNSFAENRAFDGIVVGELVWLRFYRGAIQNAEEFAVEKNLKISNQSLRYLQNEYKGIKP